MSGRHIAFYMPDLSGGGVERMRLALIAQLRAQGERVTLVLGAAIGDLLPLAPPDLPIVVLGRTNLLGALRPLARYLRSNQPDILVSSLDHNNVAAIIARLLAGVSTRVVICQHNALSAERAMGWRYRAIPWLYWILQNGAHAIVAVSRGVADDLAVVAGIPRKRITTIYNPVIGPDFQERVQGPSPHQWLADKRRPVFVFVGRLTHQKDPATLLQAMSLLLQTCPAQLIMLGEGPLYGELQAQACALGISEHVDFVGFQANPLPWIKHADALVSTSRYEGLGNVLIEALACGTPVIATDCPYGPSEILLAGEFGRLVPAGDAALMADAMLAQIHMRRPKAAVLKERAAVFTAEACAAAHLTLFDDLFRKQSAPEALGIRFSPLHAGQVTDRILGDTTTQGLKLVVTPNLDHIRLLQRRHFSEAYQSAEIVCPDGFPVLLYARLRGLRLSARVTGCDLFRLLVRHRQIATRKLFLVLESAETAARVAVWSRAMGLSEQVTTAVAPPNLSSDAQAQVDLVDIIHAIKPDVLVMTLGAPFSEIFVHQHRSGLPPCWALCVGQAVRVEVGLVARAPRIWRKLGLEWLWRIKQEPRRLLSRYARALAWFPMAILHDLAGNRLSSSQHNSQRKLRPT